MSTWSAGDTSPTPAHAAPDANEDTHEVQQRISLAPAKTPVGPGVVSVAGLILASLVIAFGVAGVRDALVAAGAVGGSPWIDAVIRAFTGLRPAFWLVPAGIILVLLGLWLLLTALRPRPRTAIALQAATGVFLRPRDVATLARSAARDVDGVTSVKVSASTRKVSVVARSTTGNVRADIAQAVTARLGALAKTPTVRVNVKTEGR